MATIEKRINKSGEKSWRVKIRKKGFPLITQTFDSEKEATIWAQDKEVDMRRGILFPYENSHHILLGDMIDRYIEEILPLKPRSAIKQAQQLTLWKNALGHMRISEVTSSIISNARAHLMKGKTPRGKTRTNATVNRYMAALSHAFTIAINEWEWATDNPCKRISRLPESRGRNRYLSINEKDRLLAACKASENKHLHTVVILALCTGARRNEILQLTWDNVHFERQVLVFRFTKNNDIRVVPLQGYALLLLREVYKNRTRGQSYVFTSHPKLDRPIDIETAWQNALKRAKIDNFRFHDLRHTAASYMMMSGANLKEVGDILGHKTVQMTQRYAHLSEAYTKKIVSKMNSQFIMDATHLHICELE